MLADLDLTRAFHSPNPALAKQATLWRRGVGYFPYKIYISSTTRTYYESLNSVLSKFIISFSNIISANCFWYLDHCYSKKDFLEASRWRFYRKTSLFKIVKFSSQFVIINDIDNLQKSTRPEFNYFGGSFIITTL